MATEAEEGVMELREAIRHRRAVREFAPTGPDEPTIKALIDAAVQAPSAMNRQPWHFAVVRDRETLDHCSNEAKAFLLQHLPSDSPLRRYRGMLADPAYHLLHHAPALVVIWVSSAEPDIGLPAGEDCCLAAQNLMLAAHAHGLGTCWIGLMRPWLATPAAKAVLGVPQAWAPVAPLVLGTPRAAPAAVGRRAPEIVWCQPRRAGETR